MGITKYEENGKELFRIYIHVASTKHRKARAQKVLTGITSEDEANRLFKKWYQWACSEVARRENEGISWGEVLEAWEVWHRKYPSSRWGEGTVRDYVATCRNWTDVWLNKPVKTIAVSDAYQLIENARQCGASTQRLYAIKSMVNVIFKWGVGSGKIVGRDHSPMFGIELAKKNPERMPEILNRDELANLLERARLAEHEWYPIWKVDAHTGLRCAELDGLRKEDIEMIPREKALELDRSKQETKNYGLIRVQRQWKTRLKRYGDTKAGYWRTVPISSQLYWFLEEYLKNEHGSDEHGRRVFPVLPELKRGEAAKVLKTFCVSEGLKPIKFHTLRACFATHLLAAGVAEAKVMKIGGWRDRETMMIYVRLAGIDEAGATEALDLRPREELLPETAPKNVVNLFK